MEAFKHGSVLLHREKTNIIRMCRHLPSTAMPVEPQVLGRMNSNGKGLVIIIIVRNLLMDFINVVIFPLDVGVYFSARYRRRCRFMLVLTNEGLLDSYSSVIFLLSSIQGAVRKYCSSASGWRVYVILHTD